MIGGLQGKEWKFIQKYLKEKISCGVGKTKEISHHAWAGAKLELQRAKFKVDGSCAVTEKPNLQK